MDVQLDVAVANRFISSLSKSLQALCHGCMDFDSGIEIVGYININIDSGSKVDYVLNEKVLKSTTNSMTFVSNSFLAKKDVPKQTRDGACSPVAELRSVANRGGYHGPRSSMQFAHLRGSHKRPWPDKDWRSSLKRSRGGSMGHPPPSSQPTSSVSSQQQSQNSDPTQALANVKEECIDNSEQTNTEASNQSSSDQLMDNSHSQLVNIKKDPDALTESSETAAEDTMLINSPSMLQGSFLQPPESSSNTGDAAELKSEHKQIAGVSNQDSDSSWLEAGVESNVGAPGVAFPSSSGDYGGAGEDSSYYQDPGEGSSDTGQFEVIEIGDEDEDVSRLFGDPARLRVCFSKLLPTTKISNRPMTSAERIKKSYHELKHNMPDEYKAYLELKKKQSKERRERIKATATDEERAIENAKTNIRMQRYRQKKKEMGANSNTTSTKKKKSLKPIITITQDKVELRRQKDRERKRSQRQGWSRQRKEAESRKATERKRLRKLKLELQSNHSDIESSEKVLRTNDCQKRSSL